MRRTIRGFIVAGIASLTVGVLGASPASALTTVNANFLSVSPGENFAYTLNGASNSTTAGVFNWQTVSGGTLNLGNTFTTFCIELTQYTHSPTLFTVLSSDQGPIPGNGINGPNTSGSMGVTKANELRELFGRDYSTSFDADHAAAFQIATWEIVYDNGLNLTAGDFQARGSSIGSTAVNLAQSWLNALNGDIHYYNNNIQALTSSNYQDQITIVPSTVTPTSGGAVPELATSSLALAGLTALGLRLSGRRRQPINHTA